MRNGKCRNCGEESVYRRPTSMGGLLDMTISHRIPIGKASYTVLINYVCSRCGYTESYVEDEPALARVAATWDKVT